ncbi:hypothetical protein FIBSPDRAFT_954247 [Athelia psychrophila]|uniref:Uncharacterized protein n=1 Tax=Athelia psychrophila TaxID=1759441 RepID=A0A166JFT8_9AGAM|nr:hypothetical protein FIBSPDRAFT_954247 [Fibularhizoctonia sp. CBS 109695]
MKVYSRSPTGRTSSSQETPQKLKRRRGSAWVRPNESRGRPSQRGPSCTCPSRARSSSSRRLSSRRPTPLLHPNLGIAARKSQRRQRELHRHHHLHPTFLLLLLLLLLPSRSLNGRYYSALYTRPPCPGRPLRGHSMSYSSTSTRSRPLRRGYSSGLCSRSLEVAQQRASDPDPLRAPLRPPRLQLLDLQRQPPEVRLVRLLLRALLRPSSVRQRALRLRRPEQELLLQAELRVQVHLPRLLGRIHWEPLEILRELLETNWSLHPGRTLPRSDLLPELPPLCDHHLQPHDHAHAEKRPALLLSDAQAVSLAATAVSTAEETLVALEQSLHGTSLLRFEATNVDTGD